MKITAKELKEAIDSLPDPKLEKPNSRTEFSVPIIRADQNSFEVFRIDFKLDSDKMEWYLDL